MPRLLVILAFLTQWLTITGQPLCRMQFYDESSGLPHHHVTQVLQDKSGFIWLATWNGLCRFDGYEFQTFKPQAGDGCHIETDRIRDIALLPDGDICCRFDNDFFLFDHVTCRYRDLTADEKRHAEENMQRYRQSQSIGRKGGICWEDAHHTRWTLAEDGRLTYQAINGQDVVHPLPFPISQPTFALHDRQGILWVLCANGVCKLSTDIAKVQRLPQERPAEVKCLYADHKGRYWVSTKDDATLRAYSIADDRLLGYLGKDGRLHAQYTPFGSPVYCMYESRDSALWLGTKPDGLFRATESNGQFKIEHIGQLGATSVYHLMEDPFGRLWVATLGDGLFYTDQPQSAQSIWRHPAHYPTDRTGQRVRYLHLSRSGILLAATTEGLFASRLEKDADKMTFTRHYRQADDATSMSSSATMDIHEDPLGRLLVSTESGGINIAKGDPTAPHMPFRHLGTANHHLADDVVQSLTLMDGGRWMAIGSHLVTIADSTGLLAVLGAPFFGSAIRLSDAHPLRLRQDRWLIGMADGACITTEAQMLQSSAPPSMVFTSVTVQGQAGHWGVNSTRKLTLRPDERSITVHFAAIDHHATTPFDYAFRLLDKEEGDSTHWTYIGHERSATLIDLKPGHYQLEIRCTGSDGKWLDTRQSLSITVVPTFWESGWGHLLLGLIILCVVALIVFTLIYISHIQRQRRETLEAYLSLLNTQHAPSPSEATPHAHVAPEDDAMMKQLMAYIEAHIDDSELRVSDLAAAVAMSTSGLQRKLKQAMGVTPLDLLREARIQHACHLLADTDKSVAEVAYACGFSDPKYFGRCFKNSTGKSPKDYKSGL